jgi:hypothetical protein
LTIALAISHNALDSRKPQREAFLNGQWGFDAITRVAIADAHAQGQSAIATHPQTQQDLLQIIAAIFTMAIRGARGHRVLLVLGPLRVRRGLPLISPIQGNRRGILMEPGSGDGVHLQGLEGHGAKHLIEIGGKQGLQDLAQPVIIER